MVLSVAPRLFKERVDRVMNDSLASLPTTATTFWADIDGGTPRMLRYRGRAMVGNAALYHSNRAGNNDTWLPSGTIGANWGIRDAQMAVMHERGGLAIAGFSRASDADDLASAAPIGISGFLLNDNQLTPAGRAGWAGYLDVQHEPLVNESLSYGLEIALKNKKQNVNPTPYGSGYGVHGIWLHLGGDPSYGGSPTAPVTSGITFRKGAHANGTANVGILFEAAALSGTDGVTGTGIALSMARGHRLSWYFNNGGTPALGASIYSTVDAASTNITQLFDDNVVQFFNSGGIRGFQLNMVASAANFLNITQSAAGNPVLVDFAGADTNGNINVSGKGTGVLTTSSQILLSASTTARASMNIPAGTAPTSPVDGDIWVAGNAVLVRLNGVTRTFTVT